jgi:hypothetical protein
VNDRRTFHQSSAADDDAANSLQQPVIRRPMSVNSDAIIHTEEQHVADSSQLHVCSDDWNKDLHAHRGDCKDSKKDIWHHKSEILELSAVDLRGDSESSETVSIQPMDADCHTVMLSATTNAEVIPSESNLYASIRSGDVDSRMQSG